MIRLDNTTRKLQVVLAGAITTNDLPVLVSWSDKTATAYNGGSTLVNTNGTTAVDVAAAPAGSTVRDIDFIAIQNADTAAATVTVRYNDNGTLYTLFKATLEVGDQLTYTHGSGLRLIDATGALKGFGAWSTPRNLSLTGDGTATLTGVDGSANVSTGLTLATVNSNVGSFGATNKTLSATVNAKGLVTAISQANIAIANTQVSGLGTMSTQNANNIAVTGGYINGIHVDSGGVILKTNAGKLSVRNNADSAAAQIEIASLATGTPNGTKFIRDDGTLAVPAAGITLGTMVASTSGTSIDFTGITAGAKSITLMYSGVSTSGTSNYRVQIGDSGGVETSGYLGSGAGIAGTVTATISGTAGFDIPTGASAASVVHGSLHLSLMDATTNLWVISGALGHSDSARVDIVAGSKALSATLDRVRFTTINGTDTFDAGNLNISWE